MADVPDCAVSGQPIAGFVWIVDIGQPNKVPMCETHGRTLQFGTKMGRLLGWNHPTVVRLLNDLGRVMDGACPPVAKSCQGGGGYPLPEPGAEGHAEPPYYVGGSDPRCAGVPDGVAAT